MPLCLAGSPSAIHQGSASTPLRPILIMSTAYLKLDIPMSLSASLTILSIWAAMDPLLGIDTAMGPLLGLNNVSSGPVWASPPLQDPFWPVVTWLAESRLCFSALRVRSDFVFGILKHKQCNILGNTFKLIQYKLDYPQCLHYQTSVLPWLLVLSLLGVHVYSRQLFTSMVQV